MENVIANDGNVLGLDSSAMAFSYNADGTVSNRAALRGKHGLDYRKRNECCWGE